MKTFAEELQQAADRARTIPVHGPPLADLLAVAAFRAQFLADFNPQAVRVARAINEGPRSLRDCLTDVAIAALRPVERWHARRIARNRARAHFDKGAVTTRRPL